MNYNITKVDNYWTIIKRETNESVRLHDGQMQYAINHLEDLLDIGRPKDKKAIPYFLVDLYD